MRPQVISFVCVTGDGPLAHGPCRALASVHFGLPCLRGEIPVACERFVVVSDYNLARLPPRKQGDPG